MADKRVTILFNQVAYAEIKAKAGLVPLGTWIKSQILPEGPVTKRLLKAKEEVEASIEKDMKGVQAKYFIQPERDNELQPDWEVPDRATAVRKPCKHGMLFCKRCK